MSRALNTALALGALTGCEMDTSKQAKAPQTTAPSADELADRAYMIELDRIMNSLGMRAVEPESDEWVAGIVMLTEDGLDAGDYETDLDPTRARCESLRRGLQWVEDDEPQVTRSESTPPYQGWVGNREGEAQRAYWAGVDAYETYCTDENPTKDREGFCWDEA